ncbi:uncharacterized protein LOC114751068 [Neltuma alba]|uniref:uncharacterized protein LOC114751068 n=1 Tax=Neltuma alba TaxID=207710 RepID=UPI0010A54076|nr:uncharacterized protein LOC114751068 [Prosopis alba]
MEDAITTTLTLESSTTTLRRRNSIATSVVLPKKLTVPAATRLQRSSFDALPNDIVRAPPSSSDLDQLSRGSSSFVSYTSLRDLLPSATPPPSVSVFGYDISIRNRLVKQAAWAYLQPMSSSPTGSSSSCFLRHFLPYLNFFYRRLISGISWIFLRISRAIWPQSQ